MDNNEKKAYLERIIPITIDDYISNGENYINNSLMESHYNILPKKIYQYNKCNQEYIDTFGRKEVWFSKASDWDDDVDTSLYLDIEEEAYDIQNNRYASFIRFGHRIIEQSLKSNCVTILDDSIAESIFSCFKGDQFLKKSFIRLAQEYGLTEDKAKELGEIISKQLRKVKKSEKLQKEVTKILEFNRKLRNSFCGACFSETFDDDHMWKEYAGKSTGFCVEYSIKSKQDLDNLEIKTFYYLLPIYYGFKERLSIFDLIASGAEAANGKYNDQTRKFFSKALMSLLTKRVDWISQREWRMLTEVSSLKSNNVSFPFATAVYLGKDIDKSVENQIMSIARRDGLKLYKQRLDVFESHKRYLEVNIF